MPFRPVFDHWFALWSSIAAAVFVLVTGILVVALLRNRAGRRTRPASRRTGNTAVEGSIVAVLAAAAAFLVWGSITANAQVGGGVGLAAEPAAPEPVRISVEAFRWCWSFDYQQAPVQRTGTCADEESFPTVVVPAGRPVEFDITSRDVVHSFWLPDFAAKRDAFLDHMNTLRMTFPNEGRWRGRCSEYCGTHHVTMDFYVRVVSPEQYQQFVDSGGATV